MRPFHLSIGAREIEEELKFFQSLGALITHRDESGYINIELFGSQITLKSEPNIELNLKTGKEPQRGWLTHLYAVLLNVGWLPGFEYFIRSSSV